MASAMSRLADTVLLLKEITCRDQESNPSCLACEPDALTTRPPRLTVGYQTTIWGEGVDLESLKWYGAIRKYHIGFLFATIVTMALFLTVFAQRTIVTVQTD